MAPRAVAGETKRAFLALLATWVVFASIAGVRAGRIPLNAIVYTKTTCPSGFTDISATSNGFVFMGAPGAVAPNAGAGSAMTKGESPTHTHDASNKVCISGTLATNDQVSANTGSGVCTTYYLSTAVTAGVCNSQTPGAVSEAESGYPFAALRACRRDNTGDDIYIEANAVFHLDPNGGTACSATPGVSTFALGQGRTLVPLHKSSGHTSRTFGAALTANALASHSHSVSSTTGWTPPSSNRRGAGLSSGLSSVSITDEQSNVPVSGTLNGADLVPYKFAHVCSDPANGVPSSSHRQLDAGALVFFNAPSCPSGFEVEDGNLVGRLLVPFSNANGETWGSTETLAMADAGGLGPTTHSHSLTGAKIRFPGGTWNDGYRFCVTSTSSGLGHGKESSLSGAYQHDIASATTGSAAASLPYLALRLCRRLVTGPTSTPSHAPTRTPSKAPITSQPTKAPRTSSPTKAPTNVPSKSPTVPGATGAPVVGGSSPTVSSGGGGGGSSKGPSASPTTRGRSSGAGNDEEEGTGILAPVVGGVVGALALGTALYMGLRRKRKLSNNQSSSAVGDSSFGAIGNTSGFEDSQRASLLHQVESIVRSTIANALPGAMMQQQQQPQAYPQYQAPPHGMVAAYMQPRGFDLERGDVRAGPAGSVGSASTMSSKPKASVSSKSKKPLKKRVTFDYYGQSDDEVSVKAGEQVVVLEDSGEEWYIVKTQAGKIGVLSKKYLAS